MFHGKASQLQAVILLSLVLSAEVFPSPVFEFNPRWLDRQARLQFSPAMELDFENDSFQSCSEVCISLLETLMWCYTSY